MTWYHYWLQKRYWIIGWVAFVVVLHLLIGLISAKIGFPSGMAERLSGIFAMLAYIGALILPGGIVGLVPKLRFGPQYTFSLPGARVHWVLTRTVLAAGVLTAINLTMIALQVSLLVAVGQGGSWMQLVRTEGLVMLTALPIMAGKTASEFSPLVGLLAMPAFLATPRVMDIARWLVTVPADTAWLVAMGSIALTAVLLGVANRGAQRKEY